jgi:NAD(P)-dependent dehydrogenase (short-subunit alcohol dehydrogenase family)
MFRLRRHRAPSGGGRSVLVTGASRGFGRLIAASLAGSGWRVFATMRDPGERAGLDEAVAAAAAEPASVTVLALDVVRPDSIDAAVSRVLSDNAGRLDAVVLNAGIIIAGAFEETPANAMRAVMDTNYFGAIDTVRATLPALRASRGRIVIISSDSALCGTPALSGYTASKYAIEGWAESVAYELEPFGIDVSMIEPGPHRTDIFATLTVARGRGDGPYARFDELAERALQATADKAPSPEPVVAAVAEALSADRPRLRYPVGTEAQLLSVGRRLLPDRRLQLLVCDATGMRQWRRERKRPR